MCFINTKSVLQKWHDKTKWVSIWYRMKIIKASLKDLIAVTGLVILLKLDSSHLFFSPYKLEIRWLTSKNKGYLFQATASFVHYFKAISEFKLALPSWNAQFRSKLAFFVPCDLEISQMTLKNIRAPLLCLIKLSASFHCHMQIQTGVTVRKRLNKWVSQMLVPLVACHEPAGNQNRLPKVLYVF